MQKDLVSQEAESLSTRESGANRYLEMIGKKSSAIRLFSIKRFNLEEIFITKKEREVVEKAIIENMKFIKIGYFTIMISTISAIEPRRDL